MAQYTYPNGREKAGFRFQSWNADNDGFETRDGWNASSLPSKYEAPRDHICKPVIIGSDGKATPVVASGGKYRADAYNAMPTALECPPRHHKDGYATNGFPSGGGNNRWDQSGDTYRTDSDKAQAFISSVQTAASNGTPGLGFPGSLFQRQKADYGSYDIDANNKITSGWSRPVTTAEPGMINTGGWSQPSRAGWGVPPEGKLGRVTNDIGTAAEFLRESARPASTTMAGSNFWSSQSPSMFQPGRKSLQRSSSVIDSREAAKKYGGKFVW